MAEQADYNQENDFTQETRIWKLWAPLSKDTLFLDSFNGYEGISKIFKYSLRVKSTNNNIKLDNFVGKNVTIEITLADGKSRYLNGFLVTFKWAYKADVFTYYDATFVPWLWMLQEQVDCRVFKDLSVPEIVQTIFEKYKIAHFRNSLHREYKKLEQTVQYNESDFKFVSRLMEREGIFYFFEHEANRHTLVMADNISDFQDNPFQPTLSCKPIIDDGSEALVSDFDFEQELRSGKYTLRDYNFENPSLDLTSQVNGRDERHYEIYHYPGKFSTKEEGDQLVVTRIEEEEVPLEKITGSTSSRGLMSAHRFELDGHDRSDFNRQYLITTLLHEGKIGSNYSSSEKSGHFYKNHFEAIPYPTNYRPPRLTPIPHILSTQTAKVVGPANEEIYTDKYGRIKVQFYWDRLGKFDENSSCWIRVGSAASGSQYGEISIPRVGMEVIVAFLEGDPDRPLVIGTVFNAENMPNYGLPKNKTKVSWKYKSTPKGSSANFNELSFENKKGSELISIHAEKDFTTTAKNNVTKSVGKNEAITVSGNKRETISGTSLLRVGGNLAHLVTGLIRIKSLQKIRLEVGGSFIEITPDHITLNSQIVISNPLPVPGPTAASTSNESQPPSQMG